jgi:AcrR family transcriptional regulator
MSEPPLSTEVILDAAEQVFRRYGPLKTTVVDVARALNVSHGTVYRYFSSKAALREAVVERWLHSVSTPLAVICAESGSPTDRLRHWSETLLQIKRGKLLEDPELFEMYHTLAQESDLVVQQHIEALVLQLTRIIEDGMRVDEFNAGNAKTLAKAIFSATARFQHPAHAREWGRPELLDEFNALWDVLLAGLKK